MVQSRVFRFAVLSMAVAVATACNLQLSTDVEATDTWTRSYPISASGTLVITSSNGRVDVTAGDVDTIEVTVERIVKAGTEEAANEQLQAFEIKEDIAPDRVSLDSASRGLQINVSRRANYTVRVPRSIAVTLESSNDDLTVTGVTGPFSASASNGRIRGLDLAGSARATTTNGVIELTMTAVAEGGVTAETTNGQVTVSIPSNANADISARVTNGNISHSNLDLQVSESSRRRLDGRLGAGGPAVRVETTNGAVRIVGR